MLSRPATGKPTNAKTIDAASDIVAETGPVAPADAVASADAATSPAATAATAIPVAVAIAAPAMMVDTVRTPVSSDNTAQPLAIAAAAIAASTSTFEASKPATTPAQAPTDPATAVTAGPTPAVDASATAAAAPVTAAPATLDAAIPGTVPDTMQAAANEPIAVPIDRSAIKPDAAVQADPEPAAVIASMPIVPVAAPAAPKVATAARSGEAAAQTSTASAVDDGEPSPAAPSTDTDGKSIAPQGRATIPDKKTGGIAVEIAKADAAKPDAAGPADAAATPHERHLPAAVQLQAEAADPGQMANTLQQPAQPVTASTPAPQLSVAASNTAAVPLNGLALQIAVTAQGGRSRFEIRLDPAELGRIDVRIDLDRHGQLTSHLTVEKPETLAMLRQDAPQLQRALDNAGFKTGDNGLQFSLRDQSSPGQHGGSERGGPAHRLIVSEDDVVPVTIAGRTYGRIPGSGGGVDIRV